MRRLQILTFIGKRPLCTGTLFAGEVVDLFICQLVIVWFPGGCSSFEVIILVSFFFT